MNLTFLLPLLGGILIGLGTTILLAFAGKIAGISGILSSFLSKPEKIISWQLLFLLGFLSGGIFMKILFPSFFTYSLNASILEIILGGILVGFGTRLGNGCTSGHGVCGLSRLSLRSFVATFLFLSIGILIATLREFLWH